jgi:hypothetical protein
MYPPSEGERGTRPGAFCCWPGAGCKEICPGLDDADTYPGLISGLEGMVLRFGEPEVDETETAPPEAPPEEGRRWHRSLFCGDVEAEPSEEWAEAEYTEEME